MMNHARLPRAVGAAVLAVALASLVDVPVQARRSKEPDEQTYQLFTREQLTQSLLPCKEQFPRGMPLPLTEFSKERRATGLCFDHFADIYSAQSKTPIVTVERLNRGLLQNARSEERTDHFFPDPRLKAEDRASLDDYKGAGLDRGHNAPAGDQATARGMAQCFSLADMSPQASKNNRGVWSKLEGDVRKYVLRAPGDVYVYTGPLFLSKPVATIGRGDVWVPSHLFKLVYDDTTHRSWAYIVPNTDDARLSAPMPYADFVSRTGYRLLQGLPVAG